MLSKPLPIQAMFRLDDKHVKFCAINWSDRHTWFVDGRRKWKVGDCAGCGILRSQSAEVITPS